MRIMTVGGTRPEIIRLSKIIPLLDKNCEHTLVHTGQNYDYRLNEIFFEELKIRQPNIFLGVKSYSFSKQIGLMFQRIEPLFHNNRPNKVLILGDTNSGLCSIVAERMGIPVYHMEAGNRCYDKEVPEEINRQIIDHISTYNLPYTPRNRDNLIKEGIPMNKIFVSGNPIKEVLDYYSDEIEKSKILNKLNLKPKKYFLSTFHRAECIDKPERLQEIILGLNKIESYYKLPIIISAHPHTVSKLKTNFIIPKIRFLEPFGFFDFIKLEKNSLCVLSDSGTVSEETCILHIPNVIIRNTTERPETLEVGSSILSGIDRYKIFDSVSTIINKSREWKLPEGYNEDNVSERVLTIMLSKGV